MIRVYNGIKRSAFDWTTETQLRLRARGHMSFYFMPCCPAHVSDPRTFGSSDSWDSWAHMCCQRLYLQRSLQRPRSSLAPWPWPWSVPSVGGWPSWGWCARSWQHRKRQRRQHVCPMRSHPHRHLVWNQEVWCIGMSSLGARKGSCGLILNFLCRKNLGNQVVRLDDKTTRINMH